MIGQTISHYRIVEKLGSGGMGVVYKAEDTRLKRPVALKFLPEELIANLEFKERFLHEARAASKLDHPNICNVHEIDVSDSGQLFICMAFYDGETLKDKISLGTGCLGETLNIILQILRGLIAAHGLGITHRDIKPGNIMITKKGVVKIVDFGLAKLAGEAQITASGTTMGTYAYMSPEQVKGDLVDSRTDIWSVGVLLYEMLTGQQLFQGEYEAAVLYAIVNDLPTAVSTVNPDVPMDLELIIQRCLEKDPEKRYQQTNELLIDLSGIKGKLNFADKESRVREKAPKSKFPWFRRKPARLWLSLLLIPVFLWLFFSPPRFVKNLVGSSGLPETKRLAILPLTVLGGDSDTQAFAAGLMERLAGSLLVLEKYYKTFWVIPSSMIRTYRITNIVQAHRILGVNMVMGGSIRRVGDMIEVEMKLYDAKREKLLNSQKVSDHLANIAVWQNGIILKTAEMLGLEQKPEINNSLRAGNTALPDAFELYITGLGYIFFDRGKTNIDIVINLLTKAVEKDPVYAMAVATLGKAYYLKFMVSKDFRWQKKALECYSRALQMQNNYVPFHISVGKIYRTIGQYDKASRQFKQGLSLEPDNYHLYQELAITYDENEALSAAENAYKRAIDLRPEFFDAYINFGYFLSYHGRYIEAEKVFRKATQLCKANTLGYNNLGSIFSLTNQNDLAIKAFQKSLNIKANSDAYSNLGTIYFFQRNYADALLMFEEAVKLAKDDYLIWGNLVDTYRFVPGYAKKIKGAFQRAIKLSRDQLVITPRDAKLRSSLAVYYAKCGEDINARTEIKTAREIAPSDISVLFKFVLVSELTGQRDQAILACQEFLKYGGRLEEVSKDPDLSGLRTDPRYKKIAAAGISSASDPS